MAIRIIRDSSHGSGRVMQLRWLLQLSLLSSAVAWVLPTTSPHTGSNFCPFYQRDAPRQHDLRRFRLFLAAPSSYTDPSVALPPAISVDSLSCTHNGGETWQVKDVSFVLPQGAKAALIGVNGSGKSIKYTLNEDETKS